MRILLLTQYYPPETGAAQNRLSDLARRLANAGHVVTVLTALPNYSQGSIFEGYEKHFVIEDSLDGVRVVRTWLYTTKKKTFLRRMLNFCTFSALSLLVGAWKIRRQDLIIVESPPLFLGVSGLFLSWLKRAQLVLNISDLWPESAVALNVVQNRRLIRLATALEELLYRNSRLITGQTEGIVANIRARCADRLIAFIPNGVDLEKFVPDSRRVEVRELVRTELGFNDHFVVGYAGLHGLAQGLETVLESARLLSDFPEILIGLIGDGPERSRLRELAEKSGLTNVRFIPTQPASRMAEVLSALDVALAPLKRHPLFKGALPSKMFEAMGAGLPVIVSVDGEARAIIEKARGGIYVEPESPRQMADAILQLYLDPALRHSLGENGRRYVGSHYSRSEAARKFEQLLLAACRS
jgi:glycosyltransferase involved in cell wall biosynthesis